MLALANVLGRLPKWRMPYSTRAVLFQGAIWPALSIVLSACAGAWAWYGPSHWSLLAALLPVLLWACSSHRVAAAAVMASYLGAAGWPVPQAVAVFNDWPMALTLVLFGVYVALYGAFWGLLWRTKAFDQALGLAIGFVALTLPPLGALYFASPLIAAGALFPGLGAWGMVLTWVLLVCLIFTVRGFAQAREITPITVATLGLACILASVAGLMNTPRAVQSTHELPVRAIHTRLPEYPAEVRERYERQFELMGLLEIEMGMPDTRLLLLPEGVAGLREPRVQWMWAEAAERARAVGLTIAVGNSVVLDTADGQATKLVNQVELMGHTSGRLRALVNVPIGSWKPWASSGHYPARWMDRPDQVSVDDQTVGAVMCWEELIAWPWLRHAGVGTSTILAASNTWFDGDGGSIDHAQRRSSWALGRLVGTSVVRAANTAETR
jgi:hypothetical protein